MMFNAWPCRPSLSSASDTPGVSRPSNKETSSWSSALAFFGFVLMVAPGYGGSVRSLGVDGLELLVVHDLGDRAASAHGSHHAVLTLGNAFAQVQHFFDARGRHEDSAAAVCNDVVVFVDGDAGHLDGFARVELDDAVARANHGDPAAVDRVVDGLAALDVPAQAVDDRAAHLLRTGCVGQDVAPAGDALGAARDNQHAVVRGHRVDDGRDEVDRGLGVGLGTELDRAGTPYDLRAVPQGAQAVGGAWQAQEIEGVGDGVSVQRLQALKQGARGSHWVRAELSEGKLAPEAQGCRCPVEGDG